MVKKSVEKILKGVVTGDLDSVKEEIKVTLKRTPQNPKTPYK